MLQGLRFMPYLYPTSLKVPTTRVAGLPLSRRWVTACSPISVSSSAPIVPFTWQDAGARLRAGTMTGRKQGARLRRWIKAGRSYNHQKCQCMHTKIHCWGWHKPILLGREIPGVQLRKGTVGSPGKTSQLYDKSFVCDRFRNRLFSILQ